MITAIIELIYNLALLVALSIISGFIVQRWKDRRYGAVLQGLLFGGVAVIGMLRPLILSEGLIFDGRSVMLSLCGLFFGPVSVAIAVGMTAACRIIQGGPGAIMGVSVIVSSALWGLFFYSRRPRNDETVSSGQLYIFGLLVHITMLLLTVALPSGMAMGVLQKIGLPVILSYPLATILVGKIISDNVSRSSILAALQESEKTLRTAFEHIHDGFLVMDLASKRFVFANNALCQMLGYTHDEMLALEVNDIHPAADLPHVLKQVERQAKGDIILAPNIPLLRKDGSVFFADINSTPVELWGRPCLIGVFRDMTEKQKMIEHALQTQKLESLGVLAGGIAHDFNNLLAGIFGHMDLARLSSNPADRSEYLSQAMGAIDRARNLTSQLLTFAKGGAPAKNIESLTPFLEETTRFALSGSTVSCRFDIAEDLWRCNFDRHQIAQVIDNLVRNAQQAMPTGGTITVSARNLAHGREELPALENSRYVAIAIIDTGSGIPKETLPRIFDPFFTTKQKGHGLGLATSYSIVAQHGGSIAVASDPGKGSTFTVYLPAVDD